MRNHYSLIHLLALRYLKKSSQEKSLSLIVKIVFLGIATGTFSLTLILGIMQGCEQETYEKLRGINPHIIMRSSGEPLNAPAIERVLQEEFPEVIASSAIATEQIMVHNKNDNSYIVITIRGIESCKENQVSNLHKKITTSNKNLPSILHDPQALLMGESLAQQLMLSIGDETALIYSSAQSLNNLQEKKGRITALFKTGIDDFDSSIIFCSLSFFMTMFPESGITQMHLAIKEDCNELELINNLRTRLGVEVYSWKELYPSLLSALTLEKYVMTCIMSLIILMASLMLMALLCMQIIQKQIDIAVLRTMGMAVSHIKKVFIAMAGIITLSASLIGLITAYGAGIIIKNIPWLQLPDIYYVTTLPYYLAIYQYGIILIFTLALGYIATIFPLRKIASLHYGQALKGPL